MAALSYASPPQILPPQGATEVRVLDRHVRDTAKKLKTATMALAHWGYRLRCEIEELGGDWSFLGAEIEVQTETGPQMRVAKTEDEYRRSLDVSRSLWYKAISIGEALSQLPLAEMEGIPVTNALLLSQVNPAIVPNYPWIREAKTLSNEEFAKKIAQRNKQHGSEREPLVRFSLNVTVSQKRFLEETLERFRKENELSSIAQALEFLVAENHDRPNATATIKVCVNLLTWALGRMQRRKDSRESREAQWTEKALVMLKQVLGAVRLENSDAKDEEAVYPVQEGRDLKTSALLKREVLANTARPRRKAYPAGTTLVHTERAVYAVQAEPEPDRSEDDLQATGSEG